MPKKKCAKTLIIAESRASGTTAILERVYTLADGYHYRVTTAKRYPTLAEAKEQFLKQVPERSYDKFKQALDENTSN